MDWRPRTCHHEAAHAVVAAAHGAVVEYVTARPRRAGHEGVTRIRWRDDDPWDVYGATLAAGPIADDIFTNIRARPQLAREGGDYQLLRQLAREVREEVRGGNPPPGAEVPRVTVQAIAKTAWLKAYATLVAHYGAVLAVAARLSASSRTVTGAEVCRLMDSADPAEMPHAGPAADFWPPFFMRGWWTPQ